MEAALVAQLAAHAAAAAHDGGAACAARAEAAAANGGGPRHDGDAHEWLASLPQGQRSCVDGAMTSALGLPRAEAAPVAPRGALHRPLRGGRARPRGARRHRRGGPGRRD